jgi:hypothetical protein
MDTDPLFASSDVVDLEEANATAPASEALTSEILQQGIVRFAPPAPLPVDVMPLSPPVVSAMQRLVAILTELRSPEGGWPVDLPQTPDNLAPYVLEEVYECLEALAHQPPESELASPSPEYAKAPWPVGELVLKLLWYVARGSYRLMQLLGGLPARVCQPGEPWQAGVVRLVVVLSAKGPEGSWALDLTTSQGVPSLLPHESLIQFEAGAESASLWVASLRQQLVQQFLTATPEAAGFLDPFPAEWLMPGQGWQGGVLRLRFGFAFSPEEEAGDRPLDLDDAPEAPAAPVWVRSLDPLMLMPYATSVIEQEVAKFLPDLRHLEEETDLAQGDTNLVAQLVVAGCAVLDRLQTAAHGAVGHLLAKLPLEDWGSGLLWRVTSSDFRIMQGVGGVPVRVLMPGAPWQEGLLRLRLVGLVETADQEWVLDLATGRAIAEEALPDDAMIAQGDQLVSAIAYLTELQDLLRSRAPEVVALLEGVAAEIQAGDAQWQEAWVRLHLDLEFVAN